MQAMQHEATKRGRGGERFARSVLEDRGMRFVDANVRADDGEIDLVMMDGEYTVFVEVKLRGGTASAMEAVTRGKRRRICNAALQYAAQREMLDAPMRFDLVGVQRAGDGWEIQHVPDAFGYCGKYAV